MEFNRQDFRKWLQKQNPRAKVGVGSNCHDCPIARWVKDLAGNTAVMAANDYILVGRERYQTPEWVNDFIGNVDEYYFWAPVSRRQCERILGAA